MSPANFIAPILFVFALSAQANPTGNTVSYPPEKDTAKTSITSDTIKQIFKFDIRIQDIKENKIYINKVDWYKMDSKKQNRIIQTISLYLYENKIRLPIEIVDPPSRQAYALYRNNFYLIGEQ